MRIFFRRILIFVLVAALFFTNINISVAASGIGKESFYQMKNEQEDTRQIKMLEIGMIIIRREHIRLI